MYTISFYSYKGGTGRTLVVANVAKYLARFGQKVFAIDFDLEAPGLQYKFATHARKIPPIPNGVVDYVYRFAVEGKEPDPISKYVIQLKTTELGVTGHGQVNLMPAGNAPCAAYWQKLAQINWHELFYSQNARGVPFFLELKKRIEKDFAPDFLLIDSRTGITEIGGIVTSVLPEKVVCLVVNNLESMEGTREVMRSIKRAPLFPGARPIDLVPVLTRIPTHYEDAERKIITTLRIFLNEKASDLASTLEIGDIEVIHSDPELELAESLRVGVEPSDGESVLLRDYLRLFSKLVPKDVVAPYIEPLVKAITARVLDDPDGAQRDLESLTSNYPHPEAFRALLKLYRIRRADDHTMVRAAIRFWNLTDEAANEPLVWEIIREHFTEIESPQTKLDIDDMTVLEEIWRATGANDSDVLYKLADTYEDMDQEVRGVRLVDEFLSRDGVLSAEIIVLYLRMLRTLEQYAKGFELIEKYKAELPKSAELTRAWANFLLGADDTLPLVEFLGQQGPGIEELKLESPSIYGRVLLRADRMTELSAYLEESLRPAIRRGPSPMLTELGQLFDRVDKWEKFEAQVNRAFPQHVAAEILEEARTPRSRARRRYLTY